MVATLFSRQLKLYLVNAMQTMLYVALASADCIFAFDYKNQNCWIYRHLTQCLCFAHLDRATALVVYYPRAVDLSVNQLLFIMQS